MAKVGKLRVQAGASSGREAAEEGVRVLWDRFRRFGILGLLREDPLGQCWQDRSWAGNRGGRLQLDVLGVERRDGAERWEAAYDLLRRRAESVPSDPEESESTERRSQEDEVCLVR